MKHIVNSKNNICERSTTRTKIIFTGITDNAALPAQRNQSKWNEMNLSNNGTIHLRMICWFEWQNNTSRINGRFDARESTSLLNET